MPGCGHGDYMTKPLQVPVLAAMLKKWGHRRPTHRTPKLTLRHPMAVRLTWPVGSGKPLGKTSSKPCWLISSSPPRAMTPSACTNSLEQDLEAAGSMAHRIKGAAVAVGAQDLGKLCAELETHCHEGLASACPFDRGARPRNHPRGRVAGRTTGPSRTSLTSRHQGPV